MRKLAILSIIVFLLASPIYVYSAFEELHSGARSLGMGDAYSAVGSDMNVVYYNPAGLSGIIHPEMLAMYANLFPGLDYGSIYTGYLGAGVPAEKIGTIGLGLFFLRADALKADGTIGHLYSENVLTFSYARGITSSISLGTNIKGYFLSFDSGATQRTDDLFGNTSYNTSNIKSFFDGTSGSSAFDLDIGLKWDLMQNLSVSSTITNLFRSNVAIKSTCKMPLSMRFGAAYHLPFWNRTVIAGDFDYNSLSGSKIHIGYEQWMFANDMFAIRAGTGLGGKEYLNTTFGASFKMKPVQVDYAFLMPITGIKSSFGKHRISLKVEIPGFGKPKGEDFSERGKGKGIFGLPPDDGTKTLTSQIEITSNEFSPNNDGINDVLSFTTYISPEDQKYIVSWSIKVRRVGQLNYIEVLRREGVPPSVIEWDGKQTNGETLPDGRYEYILEITDSKGNIVRSSPKQFILDTTPPVAIAMATPAVIAPTASESSKLPKNTTFTISASDTLSGIKSWVLYVTNASSGELYWSAQGEGEPQGAILWDGYNKEGKLENGGGTYSYVLSASDNAGNEGYSITGSIEILTKETPVSVVIRTLNLPVSTVLFETGKTNIRPEFKATLDNIVIKYKQDPNSYILIRGYADTRGPDPINWKLSDERAQNTINYLIKAGIPREVINPEGLNITLGYGETASPDESTEIEFQKNRRTEIVIIPKL